MRCIAEEYAACLNVRGVTRSSCKPWNEAKVLEAIRRYRALGETTELLMPGGADRMRCSGVGNKRTRSKAEAELAGVLENLHRYGVRTSRRYAAMALNEKIKPPVGKQWTEKSAWMLIDRYRKNGGKVELIARQP